MTEEIGERPCVVIFCKASNGYYVWLEVSWDENPTMHTDSGRKLIARAPSSTCEALKAMLNQQLEDAKL